jgi:hypothetical protein
MEIQDLQLLQATQYVLQISRLMYDQLHPSPIGA